MTQTFALAITLGRLLLLFSAALACATAASAQTQTYQVTGVAADDVLNVRSKPTTRSAVVGTLQPGASGIRLIGQPKQNGRTRWQRIQHRKVIGWVNQRFLEQSE
ncbi:MAG: SH3 domain-containing protein, partial [Pseudomonadota bacterium]